MTSDPGRARCGNCRRFTRRPEGRELRYATGDRAIRSDGTCHLPSASQGREAETPAHSDNWCEHHQSILEKPSA